MYTCLTFWDTVGALIMAQFIVSLISIVIGAISGAVIAIIKELQ